MFGFPGHWELLIIGLVIVLFFGHRLPGVMRNLGEGIRVFRSSLSERPDDAAVTNRQSIR